jgi:hypothetical protein
MLRGRIDNSSPEHLSSCHRSAPARSEADCRRQIRFYQKRRRKQKLDFPRRIALR